MIFFINFFAMGIVGYSFRVSSIFLEILFNIVWICRSIGLVDSSFVSQFHGAHYYDHINNEKESNAYFPHTVYK